MSTSSSRSATSKTPNAKVVSCPQCGARVLWEASNPYRPFCSERCKMIDLGAWATEAYRVPVEEDDDTPSSEDPSGAPPSRN